MKAAVMAIGWMENKFSVPRLNTHTNTNTPTDTKYKSNRAPETRAGTTTKEKTISWAYTRAYPVNACGECWKKKMKIRISRSIGRTIAHWDDIEFDWIGTDVPLVLSVRQILKFYTAFDLSKAIVYAANIARKMTNDRMHESYDGANTTAQNRQSTDRSSRGKNVIRWINGRIREWVLRST